MCIHIAIIYYISVLFCNSLIYKLILLFVYILNVQIYMYATNYKKLYEIRTECIARLRLLVLRQSTVCISKRLWRIGASKYLKNLNWQLYVSHDLCITYDHSKHNYCVYVTIQTNRHISNKPSRRIS